MNDSMSSDSNGTDEKSLLLIFTDGGTLYRSYVRQGDYPTVIFYNVSEADVTMMTQLIEKIYHLSDGPQDELFGPPVNPIKTPK